MRFLSSSFASVGLCSLVMGAWAGSLSAQVQVAGSQESFEVLGRTAMQRGEYNAAASYYEQALALAQKFLKEDDIAMVMHHGDLGTAYRGAGRWKDAIAQLDYAWKRCRYDAEHRNAWKKEEGDLALRYGEELGRACLGATRYDDAVMIFTFMVNDLEKAKRDETEVLQPCGLLADTLLLLKRNDDADVCVKRAIAIAEKRHADNAAVRATIYAGLANIYVQHALYGQAKPLAQHAIEITTKRSDPDREYLGELQAALGNILVRLGDIDGAEKMLQDANTSLAKKVAADSERFMPLKRSQSEVALLRGQADQALSLAQDALKICHAHYPDDSPQTALCLGQVAASYAAVKDMDAARKLYDAAVQIADVSLGKDHPYTISLRKGQEALNPAKDGSGVPSAIPLPAQQTK